MIAIARRMPVPARMADGFTGCDRTFEGTVGFWNE